LSPQERGPDPPHDTPEPQPREVGANFYSKLWLFLAARHLHRYILFAVCKLATLAVWCGAIGAAGADAIITAS
jgi:hypothetical protein